MGNGHQMTLVWISLIENGKFAQAKYTRMMEEIASANIDGSHLRDLRNESFLKVIGGGALNQVDRNLFLKNVDRVLNGGGNAKQKNGCMICVHAAIDSVFIPCGHQAACYACYQRTPARFAQCPICREDVTSVVKTFMTG